MEAQLLWRVTSNSKHNVRLLVPQTDEDEDMMPGPAEPTADASPHRQIVITVVYTCESIVQWARFGPTVPSG